MCQEEEARRKFQRRWLVLARVVALPHSQQQVQVGDAMRCRVEQHEKCPELA